MIINTQLKYSTCKAKDNASIGLPPSNRSLHRRQVSVTNDGIVYKRLHVPEELEALRAKVQEYYSPDELDAQKKAALELAQKDHQNQLVRLQKQQETAESARETGESALETAKSEHDAQLEKIRTKHNDALSESADLYAAVIARHELVQQELQEESAKLDDKLKAEEAKSAELSNKLEAGAEKILKLEGDLKAEQTKSTRLEESLETKERELNELSNKLKDESAKLGDKLKADETKSTRLKESLETKGRDEFDELRKKLQVEEANSAELESKDKFEEDFIEVFQESLRQSLWAALELPEKDFDEQELEEMKGRLQQTLENSLKLPAVTEWIKDREAARETQSKANSILRELSAKLREVTDLKAGLNLARIELLEGDIQALKDQNATLKQLFLDTRGRMLRYRNLLLQEAGLDAEGEEGSEESLEE